MELGLSTRKFNRKNCCTNCITDLPEPILIDILSRLPVKTIVNCRCVCKTWLNLLLNPHFAKIHFSRSHANMFGIQLGSNGYSFIGELDEALKSMSIIRTYPYCWDSDMVNVANGFICLAKGWDPCHILNPITGQHIVVQQEERRNSCRPIKFGLGFSRKTNELKLLRVLIPSGRGLPSCMQPLDVDIYRISTNSWTSIGEVLYGIPNLAGPFVNGALHTRTNNVRDSIFSFDFEEEKFRTVPAPPVVKEDYVLEGRLDLLEGCLSMSCRKRSQCALDIWVMNEYGVEDSWTKRYVIGNVIEGFVSRPCRLMKNGEILVVCDDYYLIYYDPKERGSRYIKFHESHKKCFHLIVPFVPNFIRVQIKDQVDGTKG